MRQQPVHVPPQVAVGDDADQVAIRHRSRQPRRSPSRLMASSASLIGVPCGTSGRSVCIRSRDAGQPRAQLAAGMEDAELVGGELAVLHQRDGQRIAKRQRHRGGGGGHHAGVAGLGRRRAAGCATSRLAQQGRVRPARPCRSAGWRSGGCGRRCRPVPAFRPSSTAPAPHRRASPCQGRRGSPRPGGRTARACRSRRRWRRSCGRCGRICPCPRRSPAPCAFRITSTASATEAVADRCQQAKRLGLAGDDAAGRWPGQRQWWKMSFGSSHPSRSSSARVGRKSKQRCARSSRPSRISRASSSAFRRCRYSTSDAAYSFCASVSSAEPQSEVCCCFETSTPPVPAAGISARAGR